jgi:hypothetical protein
MEDKAEQPRRGYRKHSKEPAAEAAAPKKGFKKYLKSAREIEEWEFGDGTQNPLHVDPEVRDRYRKIENIDTMWCSMSCMGQPQDSNVAQKLANGWVFAEEGDLPVEDFPRVKYENMRLMIRDWRLSKRQGRIQEAEAKEPVETLKRRAGEGDLQGVTLDARHSSARNYNKIKSTYERLEIPSDDVVT